MKFGEKRHLIAIGHVHIAVPPDRVEKLMHGRHGRLPDQSKGRLIEIDAVPETAVVRTIRQRRNHETSFADDLGR